MADHLQLFQGTAEAIAHTGIASQVPHALHKGSMQPMEVEEAQEKTQQVADVTFLSQYPGLSNYVTSICNLPRCYKVLSNSNLYDKETKNETWVRFFQSLLGMTTAFLNTVNIVRILATEGFSLKIFKFTPLFIILSIPIVLIEIGLCIYHLHKQTVFFQDPLFQLEDILTKPYQYLTVEDMNRLITFIDKNEQLFVDRIGPMHCQKQIENRSRQTFNALLEKSSLREKLIHLRNRCKQLDRTKSLFGQLSFYGDQLGEIQIRFQYYAQCFLLEQFKKAHIEISYKEEENLRLSTPHSYLDPIPEEITETETQKKLILAKRIYPELRDFIAHEGIKNSLEATASNLDFATEINKAKENLLEINAKRKTRHALLIVKMIAASLILITTILALTGCPITYLPISILIAAYAIDILHWIFEDYFSKCVLERMRRKQEDNKIASLASSSIAVVEKTALQ